MADDSFIREVEQELRSDKLKALWSRFGPAIIGAVVLVVLATASWEGWKYYSTQQSNASGDRLLSAVEAIERGDLTAAEATLAELQADGAGRYDVLAAMLAASLSAESDPAAAIAAFQTVASDTDTPPAIADVARIRAAYLLADHGDSSEIAALVAPLIVDGEPMRHSAREALGLASWREGDRDGAAEQFRTILADTAAPNGIRIRAEEMLALHAALGGTIPEPDPVVATEVEPVAVEPVLPVEGVPPAAPAVGLPPATAGDALSD